MENHLAKKRTGLYLGILFGILSVGWLLVVLLPEPHNQTAYLILWGSFSVLPVLATFVTRILTRDQSPWYLKPNFRKSWKTYLFAAFAPGLAIFLSGLLYFMLFQQDLDLTARNLVAQYGQFGAPETLLLTPQTILLVGIAFIFISPLVLPVHLFALGEEIGWRGYFLPVLLKMMSQRNAVLLHGLMWGLAHAPLIALGFNYGPDYWGAPVTGILMMTLVCIVLGTWLAYVTLQSQSILPAVIFHGAGNVIGELPVLVSFLSISPLIGPNPIGIVGMSGLMLGAIFLFAKMSGKMEKG
jgi:membrane protease YdiL (CAAX protease family)